MGKMQNLSSNDRLRGQGRRPMSADGTVPKCLCCGLDARKHISRNRWYASCGKKECSEHIRISNMQNTKADPEFKKNMSEYSRRAIQTQRSTLLADGTTKLQQTTNKIKESMSARDVDGLTGYVKAARKAVDKIRESNELAGNWTAIAEKTQLQQYVRSVKKCQYLFKEEIAQLENFDRRGQSGEDGTFHLDHRISIMYGFRNGIDPSIIGHICNLEMKPWLENNKKYSKCDLTIEELLMKISEYKKSVRKVLTSGAVSLKG